MVLQKILGSLGEFELQGRQLETIPIEWYETGRRLLHKKTTQGRAVVLKLLNETISLQQSSVVYADEHLVIAIEINPCEVICIRPRDMYAMAQICYEIGNKHLPLFYEQETLLVPFEQPLFHLLTAAGFEPERLVTKLLHPLKTTVSPHGHKGGQSLFSKIIQLTSNG